MAPFLSAAGLGGSTDVPRKKQEPIWMLTTETAHGFPVSSWTTAPVLILQEVGPAVGAPLDMIPAFAAQSRGRGASTEQSQSPWEAL